MDKDKELHPVIRYLWNIALAWDQFANAHALGDPDETISSRLGKIERAHSGKIPWYRPLARFLVWGLGKIENDHCRKAIEEDEGKNAIIDRFPEKWEVEYE